jgi:hypothetical protein
MAKKAPKTRRGGRSSGQETFEKVSIEIYMILLGKGTPLIADF